MSYELFWDGDPSALGAYIRKQRLQRQMQEHELEYNAWLVGSYVYEGVAVVLEHAFAKNAKSSYPGKPRKTPTERLKEQRAIEKAQMVDPRVQLFFSQFDRWTDTFNEKQGS